MKVVVAGCGTHGKYAAIELCKLDHEVTVIDKDFAIESMWSIANMNDYDLKVVIGDACDVSTLVLAQTRDADVVLSCTGDDEDNLVISLLAKQEFGVPRVIARVNHPDNEWMFNDHWGIDQSVSSPHLLTSLVEEAVTTDRLVKLLEFEDGKVELIETTLSDTSKLSGQSIAELSIPRECSVVAILREGHVVFPRPETVVDAGDEIILITSSSIAEEVAEIFEVKK